MLYIFISVGYYTTTLNYPKTIFLSNPIYMMSMADPVAIGVDTLKIDNECSLEKEFTELIHMNP